MRLFAKWRVLAGIVGCLVVGWSAAHHGAAQRRTFITMTRLYSGSDGQTHAESLEVKLMPSRRLAGIDESELFKASGAQFLRFPAGHMVDWHTAAFRQYIVTLSGRGEVELGGGEKIQVNPGQIVLAEDLTGRGHITRSIGSEDLALLIVRFEAQ